MREAKSNLRKNAARLPCLILLAVAAAAIFAVRAQAITSPYTVTSDYILFDIDKKILYCEGQSEFLFKKLRFQAKTIRVDVKSNVLIAEGNVVLTTMMTGPAATAAGAPQAAVADAPELTISEESATRLDQDVKSSETSGMQSYEGDQLKFDIERMTGELIQSRKTVRHIYFQGEALQEISELPVIGEGLYIYDDPSIQSNAVTATRFRVSSENQYEAWQAKMYIKGNKVLALPYYTNTAKKLTPGNLRLTNVKYSSNSSWGGGVSYRYKETRGKQGFIDTIYNADSPNRYTANAKQAFKLNNSTSGGVSISKLFSGDSGYSLNMMRHSGRSRSANADISYAKDRPLTLRLGGNTVWNKSRLRGYLNTSNQKLYDQASVNALINLDNDTRYIGKSRKLGYNTNAHADFNNERSMDSRGSFFVGVSAFRSGVKVTDHSHMNVSVSSGLGADTTGGARASVGTAVRYNYNISRGKLLNFSYNVRNSRSYGSSVAEQSVSAGVSIAGSSRWNSNISTGYDLRQNRFGELSTTVDYTFSKKCRVWSSLMYDINAKHYSYKNFNMTYNLYGTMINTTWAVEGNDFMVDFASNFH
ncbi:MAG: hypothetical protein WCX65_18235 [bacterium]